MSVYTNDVDTLRQLMGQSIPQVINSAVTVVMTLVSMILLNIPLTLVTLFMVGGHAFCHKQAQRTVGTVFCKAAVGFGGV